MSITRSASIRVVPALLLFLAGAGGCTTDNSSYDPNDPNNPNNPDNSVPHALGAIAIGESHASGSTSSRASVAVSFIPDARPVTKCTTTVAGCEVTQVPNCKTTAAGCGATEVCAFSDTCAPTCNPVCAARCAPDEECYFASPAAPACRKKESFDAGSLAFSGTTVPLTLFPPYQYVAMGRGSLFLAGAQLTVQASGAAGAGFDMFQDSFTATSLLQTSPGLDQLQRGVVFGTGAVPIAWTAGQDQVVVSAQSGGATASCDASDSAGKFDFPREALTALFANQVQPDSAITFSVTRLKRLVHKDKKTHGALTGRTVQPAGWLELVTSSTESGSLQACNGRQSLCGDACYNLQNDHAHCGSCTNACQMTDTCNAGKCSGPAACTSCTTASASGACKAPADACSADTACTGLRDCLTACTSNQCLIGCYAKFPGGRNRYQALANCLCRTACAVECRNTAVCG